MTSDRDLLSVPHRQSPLAVVFLAGRILRGIGVAQIAIVVFFLFSRPIAGGLFVLIPLVGVVLFALATLAWWRNTFVVVGDDLKVSKGILREDRLTIPLGRVQSVSIDQDFIRRPLNLVRASLDTAGTSEAEFTIDAIDRGIAEALQRLSAERRNVLAADAVAATSGPEALPPPVVADEVVARRTPIDLVKIGLAQSPWAGLAVIGPLLAVGDDLGGAVGLSFEDVTGDTEVTFGSLFWLVPLLIFIGTMISLVLQVSREVITNWDLTLAKTPTGLRRTSGLLSKVSRASTLARVQRLGTHQSPVRRAIGFRRLNLPTIGEGDLSLPGATDAEIERVRRLVLDPDEIVPTLDRRVSPLAVFLAVRNTLLVLAPVVAILVITFGWWGAFLFGVVPVVWLTERRSNRNFRWGLSRAGLSRRSHLVSVATSEVAMRKAQIVTVKQSFFERRRGLATFEVATAGGSFVVPMIGLDEARAVRDRVVYQAETDNRAWM